MPGRAEAALDGAGQDKGLLDEMGVFRGSQPFDGDDLGAFQVGHLGQAGTHRLAVDDHRAGAALAFAVAGLLGAGQSQILPQQIQQYPFRSDHKFMPCAIDD